MHPDLRQFYTSQSFAALTPPVPHRKAKCPDTTAFFLAAKRMVLQSGWHWLSYLYSRPWVNSQLWMFAGLCANAERRVPKLGIRYIEELASLGGPERDTQRYEQMLQLFAEVFAIDKIIRMPWSDAAEFMYEPLGDNGRRPELRVVDAGAAYNFEVKCPSLLSHQHRRASANVQLPVRITEEFTTSVQLSHSDVLLPRDNPVKDFLVSANQKFAGFPRETGANILVIVWDDFIFEPIGSLMGEFSGLLTSRSFHTTEGRPVTYDYVDAVICARQMHVFQEALAERTLPDGRTSMFDLSRNSFTPNVFVATPWGNNCPSFVRDGFGAVDHDDDRLQLIAEYRIPEYILYI